MAVTLYKHQRDGVDRLATQPRKLLEWDAGTGKTHTILAICNERPMKTLVFCPVSLVDNAWMKDAKEYPWLKVVNGRGTRAERSAKIRGDWDILVINYESGRLHLAELIKAGFKRFIIDESDYVINPSAAQSKACYQLAAQADEVYCLSATPACKGKHQYYGHLLCVAPGEVGANFYRWAGRYFYPKKQFIKGREVIKGWSLRADKEAAFNEMLARHVWVLEKKDCLSLPPKTFIERWVNLSADEQALYDSMLQSLRAEFADGRVIDAAASGRAMKLRQIVGGFIYDENGAAVTVGQTKLDELGAIIREIGPRPVVLWSVFSEDIARIVAYLNSGKVGWTGDVWRLDGTATDRYRNEAIQSFQRPGRDPRYIVAHPKSVGHGVTLTAASYIIHYNRGFDTNRYIQANERIHRISQSEPCVYYSINAAGTIDEQIDKTLKGELSAVEALRAILTGDAKPQTELEREVLAAF